MAVKITSGGAPARMQNAIIQGNKALDHNMEDESKRKWALLVGMMRFCRKEAIEKNEKYKELTNAT